MKPTFLELRCSVGDSICEADLFLAGLEEILATFGGALRLGSGGRESSALRPGLPPPPQRARRGMPSSWLVSHRKGFRVWRSMLRGHLWR